MKILFDISVLVAAVVASHSKHHVALTWLQRVKKNEISLLVSAHSFAECFAVLTRMPLSPKISPDTASYLIRENIEKTAEIITLASRDYISVMKRMVELGLSGGVIYDAITVRAAEKAGADKILTFNAKDFIRICPENPAWILSV